MSLFALHTTPGLHRRTERGFQQRRLLALESRGVARRRRRILITPGVGEPHAARDQIKELREERVPRALIARLILAPYDFVEPRIAGKLGREKTRGERLKLFHPDKRHVVPRKFLTLLQEVVVHAAAREHGARDAGRIDRRVTNHRLEAARREVT